MVQKNKKERIALISVFTPIVLFFFTLAGLYLLECSKTSTQLDGLLNILPYCLCTLAFWLFSFKGIRNTSFGPWLCFALVQIVLYMTLDLMTITRFASKNANLLLFFKRIFLLNSLLCLLVASGYSTNKFLMSFKQHKNRIWIFFLVVFTYVCVFSFGMLSRVLFSASAFIIDAVIIILAIIKYLYIDKIKGNPYALMKTFSFCMFPLTLSLLYVIDTVEYLYIASVLSIISLNLILYSADKS